MFLFSKFKQRKWIKLSAAKRQQVLQRLENKMARRAGRNPLPISVVTNPDWYCFGMYEKKAGKETLHLNISLLTKPELRFQAMATVLHEGRHATQQFVISNDLAWFQFKARRWKRNMRAYVSSNDDKNLYQIQEVERDAQIFVLKKLGSWRHKYDEEQDFVRTYGALKKQFDKNENAAKQKYGSFYRAKINREIRRRKK